MDRTQLATLLSLIAWIVRDQPVDKAGHDISVAIQPDDSYVVALALPPTYSIGAINALLNSAVLLEIPVARLASKHRPDCLCFGRPPWPACFRIIAPAA